ncbi:dephospho-CoA kinase [Methylophaga lonarensis]|uniref:dephospho-CoA kinase n=1 Tax=Methylophaga lonarensis TaxID=999151 RepID=UPI003D2DD944
MTFKIGLTGGVASGKSTVSELFAAHGVAIIDADEISRELVEPGMPCYREIVSYFGNAALMPDNTLNRAWLREKVFTDEQHRQRLEQILHPAIKQQLRIRADNCRSAYCILSVPLLIEAGLQTTVDRILVIDCTPTTQMERLLQRPGIDAQMAEAIIATQVTPEQRLNFADDVIRNDDTRESLVAAVEQLHFKYLNLSEQSL